ncbi:hypothetical protein BCR35DRAFT_332703 [Leucosporidium creatinivorum]|uniref:Uncharacterized protein n=1 Tax=Leucosporidium creatinivorum TaxID=106004 RepID=A0A1Y2EZ31_9BASI|nr:hypothetical protein BCR35DRAFT_332703 [Leucosporidium creatinivorum]
MERTLASLRAEHAAHPRGILIARAERLYRHVYGSELRNRPLTLLLRDQPETHPDDSTAAVFAMVSFVCRKMVGAVGRIEDASPLVFVGHRDWGTLNRWEKINVALAAKTYYEASPGPSVNP